MAENGCEPCTCYCGAKMPPRPTHGNWGDWRCPRCLAAYCQDCGEYLDLNYDCPHAKEEAKP